MNHSTKGVKSQGSSSRLAAKKLHKADLRLGRGRRLDARALAAGGDEVMLPVQVKARGGHGTSSGTVQAEVSQVSGSSYPGTTVWTGHAQGEPNSSVIVARSNSDPSVMAASVLTSTTNTRITTGHDGVASVDAVVGSANSDDQVVVGGGGASVAGGRTESASTSTSSIMSTVPTGTVSGTVTTMPITTIKVVDAFSMPAAAALGSWEKAAAISSLDVAITNDRMQRSGSPIRLALVDTVPLTSDTGSESDEATDLAQLHDPSDGHYDAALTTRDAYGAQFVMLYANESSCGRAYVTGSYNEAYEQGVIATRCAGDGSYAHEIGHLLGANHDTYVDPTSTPAYSHGYVDVAHGFRDIMSYSNACDAVSKPCVQLPYYSNPQLSYDGYPLGTTSTSDAVRMFREFAATVPSSTSGASTGNASSVSVSFSPYAGQSGIATTIAPKVWFSGPVTGVNSTSVLLKNSTGGVVASSVSYSATTRIATITPNSALAAGSYTIQVQPSAYGTIVKDTSGKALGWNVSGFSVGAPPQVISSTPAQGGSLGVNAPLSFTFSSWPSNASSLYASRLTIQDVSDGRSGVAWTTYSVDSGTRTMTFQHDALVSGHTYVAVLQGLVDASGNAMYPYTVTFTAR